MKIDVLSLLVVLYDMNVSFGSGEITSVNFNMKETTAKAIYGSVIRNGWDERLFHVKDNCVTFLSRKRKLK